MHVFPNLPGHRHKSDVFCARRQGHAFTLIELLVVLSIMAMVGVAVASATVHATATERIQANFDNLNLSLEAIARQATLTQTPIVVRLQPNSRVIEASAISASPESPFSIALTNVTLEAAQINGETYLERTVELLVQPSGFLRQHDLALRTEGRIEWRTWDPIDARYLAVNHE